MNVWKADYLKIILLANTSKHQIWWLYKNHQFYITSGSQVVVPVFYI